MMCAVQTGVQVRRTGLAGLAESDRLSGRDVDLSAAAMAQHRASLRQIGRLRNAPAILTMIGKPRVWDALVSPARADAACMFERKPPIRSTQEDVHELVEEIDRFVIGLAERIDAIQDAEMASCQNEVADLARTLSSDADRLGYPELAQISKEVATGAEDGKMDHVRESAIELTDVAQRVRLGHRGAA